MQKQRASSEALRSGLVWVNNNEVHINNKNDKAIAIINERALTSS